ncbi:MAG TPA: electron transfer flavoprotein subunit beta/FixA family protein [Firmicutes bacterium]|jgi:electron transfer flavoprotein beta subunit|nr:electron transfer flavoprotein subunit beta/FixA family protein [Bacillota bacterium]
MLNVIVCLKQVPGTNEVEIDPQLGTLKRENAATKINLYDLYALEAAVNITDQYGGRITVISMGPPQAKKAILEAYALGAHHGILLSDRRFAGADTLATAFTLAQAIRRRESYDLILTGMQTSDGDTAQVGPALAEFLGIPHVAYVHKVLGIQHGTEKTITVQADMGDALDTLQTQMPCLLTCTKEVSRPGLPSYLRLKAARERDITVWTYDDLKQETGPAYFGLDGSPTRVQKVFPPSKEQAHERWEGPPAALARRLYARLQEMKRI